LFVLVFFILWFRLWMTDWEIQGFIFLHICAPTKWVLVF